MRWRVGVIALFMAPLVAGCFADAGPDAAVSGDPDGAAANARAVVHDASGRVLPLASFAGAVPRFAVHDVPTLVHQPTLGIANDGVAYFLGLATLGGSSERVPTVWRSTDHGASWTERPLTLAGQATPTTSSEAYLTVDAVTGRVFVAVAGGACVDLFASDDGAATWTRNPVACGMAPNWHHALFVGPPPAGVVTQGYPNVVHLCTDRLVGVLACTASLDGGATFRPATIVDVGAQGDVRTNPVADCDQTNFGPGAVSAVDGTAFLPLLYCGTASVLVSRDAGQQWTKRVVDATGGLAAYADRPDQHQAAVTTDAVGNAYVVWTARDLQPRLASSVDGGASWSQPKRVTPTSVVETRYPALAAGADGHVALLYDGTTSGGGDAPWAAFVAVALDALHDRPVFATTQVHDVARARDHAVCVGGGDACGGVGFLDVAVDPATGTVWATTADRCLPEACPADAWTGGVVVQVAGTRVGAPAR